MPVPIGLQYLSPDLLALIVSFIPGPYDFTDPEYRNTLFSLTTICRELSDTALNKLWARLPSFIPLVYTLPRDLWTSDNRGPRERSKELVSHV